MARCARAPLADVHTWRTTSVERAHDRIVAALAQMQERQRRRRAHVAPQAQAAGRGRFEREVLAHQRDAEPGDHQRADHELVVGFDHLRRRDPVGLEQLLRERAVRADRGRDDPRQRGDRVPVGRLDAVLPRDRRDDAIRDVAQRHRGHLRMREAAVVERRVQLAVAHLGERVARHLVVQLDLDQRITLDREAEEIR